MKDNALSSPLLDLHDQSQQLVALFDDGDLLRFANPAFRAAYGLMPDEAPTWAILMRRNFEAGQGALIATTDFEAWLASALSRRGKQPFRAFEADLCDGRWIWMTETTRPDGWMLCVASDITHLRTDERALRQAHDLALRASQTDELTGIANRRHILRQLTHLVDATDLDDEAPRGCVAILDLDHFKRVNDCHGHPAGDAVLRDFARRVQALLRRSDSFGRLGGEEFMLILPEADLAEGQAVAQRILREARHARPLAAVPDFGYTCSAGLAASGRGDTPKALYARADAALYQAKQAGRDRIAVAA